MSSYEQMLKNREIEMVKQQRKKFKFHFVTILHQVQGTRAAQSRVLLNAVIVNTYMDDARDEDM